MIARAGELASTPFPMRFVLQSGDAVLRGQNGAMWNVSFSPIIERLTRGANMPYFFSVGNHDVTTMPPGDPGRALGLHNTLTAMSKLIPPRDRRGGSSGYPTYAFGYGNAFFIALDSNIASDPIAARVGDRSARAPRSRAVPARGRVLPSPGVFVGPARRRVGGARAGHRSEGARSRRAADGRDPDALHAAVPQASRARCSSPATIICSITASSTTTTGGASVPDGRSGHRRRRRADVHVRGRAGPARVPRGGVRRRACASSIC